MRTKWTRARAALATCILGASLLVAELSGAATIVSLTGSGELSLTATGTIYFDASDLAATDLLLTAVDRIEIGVPFPAGVPDPTSTVLALEDVALATNLVLDGDVYFDLLAFAGSVSFVADAIHVTGQIQASNQIVLSAGEVTIDDIGLIDAGGGARVCPTSSDATVSTGGATGSCSGGIVLTGGGTISLPSLPGDPIAIDGPPVPEPRAALLFFLGTTLLSVYRWR